LVRVHRDKLFRALDMLANGKTAREVSRETGLSFTQLKEIREVLPLYVEVRELEKKLLEVKDEYEDLLRKYHSLSIKVDKLRREVKDLTEVKSKLEKELMTLKKNRDKLEEKLRELENASRNVVEDLRRQLLDKFERMLGLIDSILKETKLIIQRTPKGIYAHLTIFMPSYRVREVFRRIVKEHGLRKEEVSEIGVGRELHFQVIVAQDTKIDDIIREIEKEHRELLGLKELLEKARIELAPNSNYV